MPHAFDDWTPEQRDQVKAYVDNYPLLSDAEMAVQMKKQRAVGFWPLAQSIAATQEQEDDDQFLIDCLDDYEIVASDSTLEAIIKQRTYINDLITVPQQIEALIDDRQFWDMYNDIGFISAVRTSYSYTVVHPIAAGDIADIRAMP